MNAGLAQRRWIALGSLLLVLLLTSYPIRYVQQAAFGQVVLYTGVLRLLLFLAIFALAVLTAAHETSRDQFHIVALGYLLLSLTVYNLMVVDFGAFYVAFGANFFLVPPAIALILLFNATRFSLRDEARERAILHLLLIVALPIALFGILQFALNDPILHEGFGTGPVSEYGGTGQAVIRLTELAATHRIRANAIFGSAIEFGHFATLFAVVCFGLMLKNRGRASTAVAYALMGGVFVVAVLSTNTRNILLFFGCCAIGSLLLHARLGVRTLAAAALALVGVFYTTIYGLIALAPGFFAGFFDSVSLFERARGVYVTVEQYIVNADSLAHVLFGYGYMQSVDFKFLPTTIFDNTELDIYLYAGVCGVVLYVALLYALFSFAVRQWRETGRVAWLAVASLLFGTPLFSTMNIDLDQPCFLFVFALVVAGAASSARRSGAALGTPATAEGAPGSANPAVT
jgi:hypothetical protein